MATASGAGPLKGKWTWWGVAKPTPRVWGRDSEPRGKTAPMKDGMKIGWFGRMEALAGLAGFSLST